MSNKDRMTVSACEHPKQTQPMYSDEPQVEFSGVDRALYLHPRINGIETSCVQIMLSNGIRDLKLTLKS